MSVRAKSYNIFKQMQKIHNYIKHNTNIYNNQYTIIKPNPNLNINFYKYYILQARHETH